MEYPGAVGDDGAATAVGVGPPAPLAVVVGVAAAVAGDAVPHQGSIAYEPGSAAAGEAVEEPPGVLLALHVHLVVVLLAALARECVARARGGRVADASKADPGVNGGDWCRVGRGGHGQDKEEGEAKVKSHAGRGTYAAVSGGIGS